MAQGIQLRAAAQNVLAYGSISSSYTAIGVPFTNPIRLMVVYNLTNATLQFSFTGNTDHFVLAAGDNFTLDVCTNEINNQGWFISTGTQMYVKEIGTPTSGSVYVSSMYAGGN